MHQNHCTQPNDKFASMWWLDEWQLLKRRLSARTNQWSNNSPFTDPPFTPVSILQSSIALNQPGTIISSQCQKRADTFGDGYLPTLLFGFEKDQQIVILVWAIIKTVLQRYCTGRSSIADFVLMNINPRLASLHCTDTIPFLVKLSWVQLLDDLFGYCSSIM